MNVTDRKISTLPARERDDLLTKAINGICRDYSLDIPSVALMESDLALIKESYPNISVNQIRTAFRINAAGMKWDRVSPFGACDNNFIGSVMSRFLMNVREENTRNYVHQHKEVRTTPWTIKESFDQVFAHKEKHGHFPKSIGVYHLAYEHAVQIRDIKHDPKEWGKAVEWATKNIDKLEDEFLLLISKGREDNIMRLAKKQLFTQHYEK